MILILDPRGFVIHDIRRVVVRFLGYKGCSVPGSGYFA